MHVSVWILLISGFLLLSLALLLATESKIGRRIIFGRTRAFADLHVVGLQSKMRRRTERWGTFNIRTLFHYLFHQLLGALLFLNGLAERYISRLRYHNKKIAHRAKQISSGGHLAEIAAHKGDTALSDEEKTARKEHALRQ
ncbi:hypothetical protein A2837_01535 [Candidatus Kaiserbacteria bacterium RIFCSPHIGHO2_01_FULL_46_22]|uniref:Uncharacterized protein n=1 Tax=Candidatus Kaiserbacteria bacterium RIFCSPHIGHO2_01_FULL_46_22 TaxID=1798475 RepID=A0A1F6BY50_9BACT|nr:MAG: hypothetical protein A2837_01535 [Candidatus Kaiserbacteria bacterium RIFCSPHIGHO2_01_FULL_46_22]